MQYDGNVMDRHMGVTWIPSFLIFKCLKKKKKKKKY